MTIITTTREIRLASRPVGAPTPENFALATVELPALDDGQVLVIHLGMSGQLLMQDATVADEKHLKVRLRLSPRA